MYRSKAKEYAVRLGISCDLLLMHAVLGTFVAGREHRHSSRKVPRRTKQLRTYSGYVIFRFVGMVRYFLAGRILLSKFDADVLP